MRGIAILAVLFFSSKSYAISCMIAAPTCIVTIAGIVAGIANHTDQIVALEGIQDTEDSRKHLVDQLSSTLTSSGVSTLNFYVFNQSNQNRFVSLIRKNKAEQNAHFEFWKRDRTELLAVYEVLDKSSLILNSSDEALRTESGKINFAAKAVIALYGDALKSY